MTAFALLDTTTGAISTDMVDAGWLTLRAHVFTPMPDGIDLTDLRRVYFCGAFHIWTLMLGLLDTPGMTEEQRESGVAQLHEELIRFEAELMGCQS